MLIKRAFLFLILLCVLQFITYGQVETRFFPNGDALNQVIIIKNYPEANIVKKFPLFNVQELEDNQLKDLDIPFRFGNGFDTYITLNIGTNGNY
jgi:lysyl endopeptidase